MESTGVNWMDTAADDRQAATLLLGGADTDDRIADYGTVPIT